MNSRLLLLAALLACNALYLIWKAKGSPAIRLDLEAMRACPKRFISRLMGIFASERDLKQSAADDSSLAQPLQSDFLNIDAPDKEGLQ